MLIAHPAAPSAQEQILPSAIAGAFFGFLALLVFFIWCVWIGLNFCRCCCTNGCCTCWRRGAKQAASVAAEPSDLVLDPSKAPSAQTIDKAATEVSEEAAAPASLWQRWRARRRGERWLLGIIAFLGLATVGLCLWGIPESLTETNSQIDDFWDLFDNIDNTQRNTTAQLVALRAELETVENALQTLSNEDLTVLQQLPGPLGDVGDTIVNGLTGLTAGVAAIGVANDAIDSALVALDTYVQSEIDTIRDRFREPTTTFQSDGRVVTICIMLGVILLCAVVIPILAWRPSHPVILSYTIATLLFFVFLILLLGAGVVRSMVELAHDGCLYAEYYAGNVLVEAVNDPTERQFWRRTVNFYLDPTPPAGDGQGSALEEITGVNISPVLDVLDSAPVQGFLDVATSGPVTTALGLVLNDESVAALGDLANAVPDIVNIGEAGDVICLILGMVFFRRAGLNLPPLPCPPPRSPRRQRDDVAGEHLPLELPGQRDHLLRHRECGQSAVRVLDLHRRGGLCAGAGRHLPRRLPREGLQKGAGSREPGAAGDGGGGTRLRS